MFSCNLEKSRANKSNDRELLKNEKQVITKTKLTMSFSIFFKDLPMGNGKVLKSSF